MFAMTDSVGQILVAPGVWFFVQYPDKYFHASTFMPAYSNQGVFFFS